ncbi:PAS domain-containing sensor histidine kinase [Ferruginibacter paludis]|uniref:PAS domain-containing sensor histidine kinase n=1 Tax=Ferruginibacter paludis TaxID=1310417 RepID=UPI0025B3113E|nr:PAS domain-containing sensor histidine kinase [Ferruginibacter paludis]MDN3656911.1 PAS domain-containing sensor histidine kinase [Ferruginibacter paludis]
MPQAPVAIYNHLNYFNALFHEAKENAVLLLDTDGIVLEVNKAFISSFGYERDDVCGKHFRMLFTEEDRLKDRPDKEIAAAVSQGQAYDNNYLVQKDNVITWVSGESTLIKDEAGKIYVLKIIQNINEQKISENAIISLSNFTDSILKSIEDGIVVLNKDLKIIRANESFSRLFALGETKIADADFAKLIARYDKNNDLLHKIQLAVSSKKGFSNVQLQLSENTAQEKIFEVNCSPVKDGSTESNVLLIVHDITVQKQAERDRDDMIGFIGHELRNPITNVLLSHNLLEALVETNDAGTIKELLERSKKNVLRLNRMINELYNSTKINAGHFELEKTEFYFTDMISEAVETVQMLHPDYKIAVDNSAGTVVTADRYRLVQVVTNYLGNSIKYAGGKKDIRISITIQNNFVEVAVKDQGIGIAKAHLPFIFDRFFRAEKTMNLEGIGLGLFLCKQIIHAHNGHVWAESEEGDGSTFYFSIPLRP